VYGGDKIHNRYGLSWRHPVHEVLKKNSEMHPEVQRWVEGIQIHHHPDSTKSRAQYLPLLELAVEEDPRDDRIRSEVVEQSKAKAILAALEASAQ
jgi:hypothetical protein